MYDDSFIEETSTLKRWYRNFDRLNPFLVGFLTYMALMLVYSFLPFGMQDIGYQSKLGSSEILVLILVIGSISVIPFVMFLKGAIQNRQLPLCIIALIFVSLINLINIARLIRLFDALFAVM